MASSFPDDIRYILMKCAWPLHEEIELGTARDMYRVRFSFWLLGIVIGLDWLAAVVYPYKVQMRLL